jgi:nitronate monooxygenase
LIGTRFQATTETLADPATVKAIIDGRGQDTERSTFSTSSVTRYGPRRTRRTLANPHLDRWRARESEAATDTPNV